MQSTHQVPRLIGISGAAKIVGKSQKTIRRWIDNGTLKPAGRVHNGNANDAIVLLRDEVEALAQQLGKKNP
jgi:predicted site-specific integrase-resolvase